MLIVNLIKKLLLLKKNKEKSLMEKIKKMLIHLEEIYYMPELEQHPHGCKDYENNNISL